jgi:hypothetical protein
VTVVGGADLWPRDTRRGNVLGMDIGPVRRRLTAEPISSPVPGEDSPIHEEPALTEHEQDASETVVSTRA